LYAYITTLLSSLVVPHAKNLAAPYLFLVKIYNYELLLGHLKYIIVALYKILY